jgi:hypothetical protein
MLLHYTDNPESIITESINNICGSALISNKQESVQHFYDLIEREVAASNLKVKYTAIDSEFWPFSFAEEVITKAPLYANLLVSLGYRSILFVQHFRAGYQLEWLVPGEKFMVSDYNVLFHFVPMLMKHWPYKTKVSVTSSDESKFKIIMNNLYSQFMVNGYKMDPQYDFTKEVSFVDTPVRKYDAVVFLGVPNAEVTSHDLRSKWEPFCNPGFDLIHMNSAGSTIVGEKIDISDKIETVFTNRKDCDPMSREIGCTDEMLLMEKSVSVF